VSSSSPTSTGFPRTAIRSDRWRFRAPARRLAAASRVRLIRRDGEVTSTYIADLDEIRDGDNRTNALLQSGDLVMVPPATPVGVGYALRRVLYPFEVVLGTLFRAFFWFV
jgi:hypothetical protein